MPILAAELNVFPDNLLDETEERASGDLDVPMWWIFHTRPRQEKCLARDLRLRDVPFYLPLVPRRLLIRGRPIHSFIPLFDSYVFVRGTREDRVRALATKRVAQVLEVSDGNRLRSDLKRIQCLIDSGAPLTVESRLEANQLVRIRSGSMQGLEGTVATRKNKTRLIVWVKMLQQGVSVEIDDCLLEPIG